MPAYYFALASANSTRTLKVVKQHGDIHVYERWFEVEERRGRRRGSSNPDGRVSAGVDEILPLIQHPDKVK